MDGKGFEDDGLGERYPYASEPDETKDPLPLRRPGLGYVFRSDDDDPLGLPSRPHEPESTAQYRAWGADSGYDPELFPSEPYVGNPRDVRPYVAELQPIAPPLPPTPPPDRLGPYGSPPPSYGSPGYESTGYGDNGNGATGYSPNGYGEQGHGQNEYPSDPHAAPVYRGRARAQSQSYASGYEIAPAIESGRPSEAFPAVPTRGGYSTVGYEQPVPEFVTRPGYSLTEELAEQRRQDARRDEDDDHEDKRTPMPLWQELPLLLVVAFCVAVLIRSFLVQAFFIPSSSMEQTLLIGDRVLVNKILYDVRAPERGEVVVFRGTDRWAPENYSEQPAGMFGRIGETLGDLVGVSRPDEKDFIKRVIGLPGDRVACCDDQGRVTVNGVGIDEPYINANSSLDVPASANVCGSRRFTEVVLPAGQLFVMGDNRAVSQDSRCQGPVPIENVIGRAFVIVWPSDRWDTLSAPDTFDAVPAPAALGPVAPVRSDPVGAVVALPVLASLVGSSRPWLRRARRARRLPR